MWMNTEFTPLDVPVPEWSHHNKMPLKHSLLEGQKLLHLLELFGKLIHLMSSNKCVIGVFMFINPASLSLIM